MEWDESCSTFTMEIKCSWRMEIGRSMFEVLTANDEKEEELATRIMNSKSVFELNSKHFPMNFERRILYFTLLL